MSVHGFLKGKRWNFDVDVKGRPLPSDVYNNCNYVIVDILLKRF